VREGRVRRGEGRAGRIGFMVRAAGAVILLAGLAACAARTAPPLPAVLAYPDFVYPAVPAGVGSEAAAAGIERGWRYLQNRDLAGARAEFASAGDAGFYPARTGEAYVALAAGDYADAAAGFEAAVDRAPAYAPALAGLGQAMLGLDRNPDALAAFEAALAADPALSSLAQRVDLLRFRVLQEVIDEGRAARDAGRLDDARAAYLRAIEASPETAFLHRDLGIVEQERGDLDAALARLQEAVALDGSDVDAAVALGGVYEQRGDYAAAVDAYQRAAGLGPDAALASRIETAIGRARDAMLPAEFRAIGNAAPATRGDLAALIGVRLGPVLAAASPVQVVVTDIRTHWAAQWVAAVIRAGVIDEFPNHTFQPDAPLRRVDLASAVRRVVALLAESRPALRADLTARPEIADVAPGHLNYPDVAAAVASGVMPLVDGRFGLNEPVTGSDAIAIVGRLQALAGGR